MDIRNIAIIAHVDHGKTTLVDGMLKQSHTFRENQVEMNQTTIMDSNALEREKGITILAKNTAVMYKGTKINIIDTPGHADFSGEVERVINMADSALLIIDAAEGPLPQTKFVLEKAFSQNLKIIVVINKIDRKDARVAEVIRETEDLFLTLANHDDHLSFTLLFAVGREGKTWKELPADWTAPADLTPLFKEILSVTKPTKIDETKPFKMLVSTLDFDNYKGTYAIGKVAQGIVKKGQKILQLWENEVVGTYTIENVFTSIGLQRNEVDKGECGDIIALTGIDDVAIGQTLADPSDPKGYQKMVLGEPTLKMIIGPNTSPLSGKEGKFHTARQLEERLKREKKTNIGLQIETSPFGGFEVSGRGELHLSILIENLRREGYELQVGKPQVILKKINEEVQEPFQEVTVEVDKENVGIIIEEMGRRKAVLVDSRTNEKGITRMVYTISTLNLLGFRSVMMTSTRGNGIFASRFIGYRKAAESARRMRSGALVAYESGITSSYALETVQKRGQSFIGPGVKVYEGMIIGLNNRQEDIDINVCKTKKLTNMHTENSDIAIHVDPPVELTLEQCLDIIEANELLEVTPLSLRLRKRYLTRVERTRAKRN